MSFDGVSANGRRDLVFAQATRVDLLAGLAQFVDDVAERLLDDVQPEIRRHGIDQKRLIAKATDADA